MFFDFAALFLCKITPPYQKNKGCPLLTGVFLWYSFVPSKIILIKIQKSSNPKRLKLELEKQNPNIMKLKKLLVGTTLMFAFATIAQTQEQRAEIKTANNPAALKK